MSSGKLRERATELQIKSAKRLGTLWSWTLLAGILIGAGALLAGNSPSLGWPALGVGALVGWFTFRRMVAAAKDMVYAVGMVDLAKEIEGAKS